MTIIDSHVHIIDDPHYHGGNLSAEELIRKMDAAGVARAIIVQSKSGNGLDSALPADSARRFPHRLIAVSGCDALRPDAAEMIRLRVEKWGARGIRLFWCGWNMNDTRHDPMWATTSELGVPILLAGGGARYEELPRLARRFRNQRFVLDYLVDQDISQGVPAGLLAIADQPNVVFKFFTTYLIDQCAEAKISAPDLFKQLVTVFGAERLMWGSNYPSDHEPRWPYQRIVDATRELLAPHRSTEQERMYSGTAISLWPELGASATLS